MAGFHLLAPLACKFAVLEPPLRVSARCRMLYGIEDHLILFRGVFCEIAKQVNHKTKCMSLTSSTAGFPELLTDRRSLSF